MSNRRCRSLRAPNFDDAVGGCDGSPFRISTLASFRDPSAIKGRWWYSERVDHRAAVDRVGMSYFTVLFEQDISAPSTSAGLSTYSWTNGNVTATASASDGAYGSGIGHHYCRLEGEGWTDAGASSTCTRTATANTTFYYYAVDKAGNTAAVKSLAARQSWSSH